MISKNLKHVFGAIALMVGLGAQAYAVNSIPLKPDASNAAPCTVFGSPSNGMSCGKTTAPNAALDVDGSVIVSKKVSHTRTALSAIQASTTISVTSTFETLLSTGGSVIVTATPSISTTSIKDGTFLVLASTSTTSPVVLQDNGSLSGSQLELGAASRTISGNATLTLIFDLTLSKWKEIAFSAN